MRSRFDVWLDEKPSYFGASVVNALLEGIDGAGDLIAAKGRSDSDLGSENDFARALLKRDKGQDLDNRSAGADEIANGALDCLIGALAEKQRLDLDGEKDGDDDEHGTDGDAPGGIPAAVTGRSGRAKRQ